ncbi:phosphate ABC transporter substrate-binding protein PstS [Cyanobium sp. Morenito 9A2]|uniref:phosphate ABC transporter substrate-binding protein PstS n=1 Tax=Cyanobium sp. Morenito 9A2 TaxID=2823718 RepID=UPI0020CF5AF9|nr:phosphate ABC transporter substrate-binding protein PstS [Cyanobium sp. Morenito 9A2]MCP9850336.1 phosphate ABC transporter substrate-binding protein PstS [Cyanobium sp. Morenito 9A2]
MPSLPSNRLVGGTFALLACAVLSACGGSGKISGAGASFPASIYTRWFADLATKKGLQVAYQSVGSGAGVRQLIAQTVDFGASDAPMRAEDIARVSRGVVQVPMTAGAIAVAYNFPGCDLKLSQSQLAGIFLGTINNFNQVGCGNKAIRVVHRSDGSGTTFNFTAHLAAISPSWSKGPGNGTAVSWPTGIGAKGNEGVAAQLTQVDGSLGYVEQAFVRGTLQAAALTNGSGQMTKPTNETASQALATIDLGPDLIGSDPNPKQGYPIVTFTWILLYKTGNGARTEPLKTAFNYTLSPDAQGIAPKLGFVSLPEPVVIRARAAVASIVP